MNCAAVASCTRRYTLRASASRLDEDVVRLHGRELERALFVLGSKLLGPDLLLRDRRSEPHWIVRILRAQLEEVIACHVVRAERLAQHVGSDLRLEP